MKEYFMMGLLCIINPLTGQENCAYIHEDPIKYYSKEVCREEAVKKVNEMGANLTSEGIHISYFLINCIVDKKQKNT